VKGVRQSQPKMELPESVKHKQQKVCMKVSALNL